MLYLWIFGDNVEDSFGSSGFVIFYLLCGIGATLAQVAVDPRSSVPNLGASGAIAGVLASYLVMFPNKRVQVLLGYIVIPMPALIVIGFWFVLQLLSVGSITSAGQTGGVAYMAHIGGFVTGLVLTSVFRQRGRTQYYLR
jgi:membrane associated rhomboid family serine protease